jgi:hypothetical protein
LKSGHERILGKLFRQADVVHHVRYARDDLWRLDPPDRLDRAINVRQGGRFEAG